MLYNLVFLLVYTKHMTKIDAFNDMDLYADETKINREKWRYMYICFQILLSICMMIC